VRLRKLRLQCAS